MHIQKKNVVNKLTSWRWFSYPTWQFYWILTLIINGNSKFWCIISQNTLLLYFTLDFLYWFQILAQAFNFSLDTEAIVVQVLMRISLLLYLYKYYCFIHKVHLQSISFSFFFFSLLLQLMCWQDWLFSLSDFYPEIGWCKTLTIYYLLSTD